MQRVYKGVFVAVLITGAVLPFFSCSGGALGGMVADKRSSRSYKKGSRIEGAAGMSNFESSGDTGKLMDSKKADRPEGAQSSRMIIYTAQFSIEVIHVEKSVKRVYGVAEQFGGFIESSVSSDSYRRAKVILRVPVKKFDRAVKAVSSLGRVTSKEISASDVTREFRDVSLRVNTAKKVRARMYALLKRTKKVAHRVKILREIERLTTKIETLQARLKYLKSRADFSTITVDLYAKVSKVVSRYTPSPFKWIASLKIDIRTITDNGGDIEYEKPEGFFYQKEDYYDGKSSFLFSSPGGKTGIRAGVTENYPPADLKFWKEAVDLDFKGRRYRILKDKKIKGHLTFNYIVCRPSLNKIYALAFAVHEKKIVVIEARFESKKEFDAREKILKKFIKSVRID